MLECQSVSFEVKYSPTQNYLRIRSLSEASCDDTFTLTGKQAQTNKQTPGESELPPPPVEKRGDLDRWMVLMISLEKYPYIENLSQKRRGSFSPSVPSESSTVLCKEMSPV